MTNKEIIELLEENRQLQKANLSFAPIQIKLQNKNRKLKSSLEYIDGHLREHYANETVFYELESIINDALKE